MAIERIGQTLQSAGTITPVAGSKAGHTAVVFLYSTSGAPSMPAGWTELGRDNSGTSYYIAVYTKVLTAADLGPHALTSTTYATMEVWSGVGPVLIGPRITASGNSVTLPALAAPKLSIPLWLLAHGGGNNITKPVIATGTFRNTRHGVYFGNAVTGTTTPAATFSLAVSGTASFRAFVLALTPGAPPYNMFRIDASGETGLTPVLIGTTTAGDTELRWEP